MTENFLFNLKCSSSCGQGIQIRNVECISPETRSILPFYKCDTRLKPTQQRSCMIKNCSGNNYEWKIVSIRPVLKNLLKFSLRKFLHFNLSAQ